MKTITSNNTNSSSTLTQIKSPSSLLPTHIKKPALVKQPPRFKLAIASFSPEVSQFFLSLFFFLMGILVMAKIIYGF